MPTTLDRARDLVAPAAKAAEDTERQGRLPDPLWDDLAAAGCLRMLAPRSHGGDELPAPEVLRVVETLARGDGSVGWCVGQAAMAQVVLAYFPRPTIDRVYAAGPDVVGAGAVAPKGKAKRTGDGWRVSGQWPFVTGCQRASWFYGQCLVLGGSGGAGELPDLRLVLFPADGVAVVPTWQVLGLRGTGSHDVRVGPATCPEEDTTTLVNAGPTLDADVYRIPTVEYSGMIVSAAGVGVAAGAVDAAVELAGGGKRPAFSARRLASSPVFQDRIGEAYLAVAGARALLHAHAEQAWRQATAGQPLSPLERAVLRATAAEVTATATRAVDLAYQLSGGSAVYDGAPVQRRLRDMHTVTQHAVTAREMCKILGAALVGEQDQSLLW